MAEIIISPAIEEKIRTKHNVTPVEVRQCFDNRTGALLADTRDDHDTDPPTRWFIALTNKGRLLKVCFVPRSDFFLRTAYPPNEVELAIYRKHGRPHDF